MLAIYAHSDVNYVTPTKLAFVANVFYDISRCTGWLQCCMQLWSHWFRSRSPKGISPWQTERSVLDGPCTIVGHFWIRNTQSSLGIRRWLDFIPWEKVNALDVCVSGFVWLEIRYCTDSWCVGFRLSWWWTKNNILGSCWICRREFVSNLFPATKPWESRKAIIHSADGQIESDSDRVWARG